MRALLALALWVAACGDAKPGAAVADERAQLELRVRELFAAIAADDCVRVAAIVPDVATAPGKCEAFVHEWNDELRMELVDFVATSIDGRDPAARLVTARVRRRGKVVDRVFKLEREAGQWVISH